MDWYRSTEQIPGVEESARSELAFMEQMWFDGAWTTSICHRATSTCWNSQRRWTDWVWGAWRCRKMLHPPLQPTTGGGETRDVRAIGCQTWKFESAGQHRFTAGAESSSEVHFHGEKRNQIRWRSQVSWGKIWSPSDFFNFWFPSGKSSIWKLVSRNFSAIQRARCDFTTLTRTIATKWDPRKWNTRTSSFIPTTFRPAMKSSSSRRNGTAGRQTCRMSCSWLKWRQRAGIERWNLLINWMWFLFYPSLIYKLY